MKTPARAAAAVLSALFLATATAACAPTYSPSVTDSSASCSQLLTTAISQQRSGSGDIDSTMQALSDNCSDEYEIATDYLSSLSTIKFSGDSCDELLKYGVRREAVTMLERDGHCRYGESKVTASPDWPNNGLGWDKARSKAGTVQRVCGPLRSLRNTEDGAFVNVGRDYPSADRFTFILWDTALEPIASGATVCARGKIYLYNGVTQMELQGPKALEIWR